MQKFTSEELAKFKAADPDDVVCVRVGQIAVLIEQVQQLLAKDVRSEEEKAEYRSLLQNSPRLMILSLKKGDFRGI